MIYLGRFGTEPIVSIWLKCLYTLVEVDVANMAIKTSVQDFLISPGNYQPYDSATPIISKAILDSGANSTYVNNRH